MWVHALLYASQVDRSTYNTGLQRMANSCVVRGSPLHTYYMLLADGAEQLFAELPSKSQAQAQVQ